MKLSHNLPQFEGTPTLLVVSGWQSGKVFYALNGNIVLDGEVLVPDHRYSDREGHFKMRTRGVVQSGSVYEQKKEHIRKEFLGKFVSCIDNVVKRHNIKEIHIFSPPEGLHDLEKAFPAHLKKYIRGSYSGNYIHHKPDKLAEIIKGKKLKPIQLMSEEAKKILDRFDFFRRSR